jgi:hypothetical protein
MERRKGLERFPTIRLEGNIELGSAALEMVSIMA